MFGTHKYDRKKFSLHGIGVKFSDVSPKIYSVLSIVGMKKKYLVFRREHTQYFSGTSENDLIGLKIQKTR